MAWHFTTNQTLATLTQNLWTLISLLTGNGWSQVSSSDASSFGSPGPVSSGYTGTNGLDNASAWVVVQAPGGGPSFCFQHGTDGKYWRVKYSPSAGFTGGSPSATQTPAATDEYVVCGFGTNASPVYNQWFANQEGNTRYSCAMNDAAPYSFWANGWPIGGGTPIGGIWFDGVQNAANSMSSDADQHVLNVDSSQGGWNANGAMAAAYTAGNKPVVNTMAACAGVNFPWTTPSSGLSTDYSNGKDMLRPLEFYFTSGGYYKGQTETFFWEMTGTSTSPRSLAYLLSLVSSADYIIIGQLAVPWDGSSPLV
jgi:hypothetical protein